MIKGLLIEDDQDNIDSYTERFALHDIELLDVKDFPKSAADFWRIVVEMNVDFIIIDNHLHKKSVQYEGLDVLKEIRKQDSEIYIVYLTCKGIDKTKTSEFDLEIEKGNLTEEFQNVVQRIKRAHSREVAYKLEREIDNAEIIQKKYYEEQLKVLKEKLS